MKYLGFFVLLCLFTWHLPGRGYGQFSPGDFATPHEHLKGIKNCTYCHVLGEGERAVDEKCLECHTPIAERVRASKGLHARVDGTCADCHPEHNGRDFALIYWENGKDQFDHARTGFMLEGAHTQLQCDECHAAALLSDSTVLQWETEHADRSQTQTYLGLPTTCLGCHEDYHQKQLGDKCTACHTQEKWVPAEKFDHDIAEFHLSGKHSTVKCIECHKEATLTPGVEPTVRYTGLQHEECSACHEDVHDGQLGSTCSKCHKPDSWQTGSRSQFNHDLTSYPLRGEHRPVDCEKCHQPGQPKKPLAHENCTDCHEDYHDGQFADRKQGNRCEPCHNVDGFVPAKFTTADHRETDFPLTGAHAAQPCIFCHEVDDSGTEQFRWEPLLCTSCHRDEHEGQFAERMQGKDCTVCHRVTAWSELNFTHETTDFPLRGRHRKVECAECHKPENPDDPASPVQYTGVSPQCHDCHEDIHFGQFADGAGNVAECERCHSPTAWTAVKFDHNSMSRFALDGKHRDVPCGDCHPSEESPAGKTFVRYKPLGKSCQDCHTLSNM
ncbi:MAG: hypothetical protein K9N46_06585 [Candidatus Marinimicrobia bacterium]|nr:hypothetical protein [Candidatus Neomarinimicrobiota bacterium]MCF7828646.1 hypothetical protein [Candidatus Neomarinimicrobiota bacterium]MCF7880387.1 hypothetical protein [Candidatus Neomarinimicrobiota bacterium]